MESYQPLMDYLNGKLKGAQLIKKSFHLKTALVRFYRHEPWFESTSKLFYNIPHRIDEIIFKINLAS